MPQTLLMQPLSSSPTASAPWQRTSPTGPAANSHMWRMVGVHDGDTLTYLDENHQWQKVRLAEIDAPALGQDFGKVSREALASMVLGRTVEMVAAGNAWHDGAYSKDKSLAQLQADARSKQIGLQAQPNPITPWQFRADEKKTRRRIG